MTIETFGSSKQRDLDLRFRKPQGLDSSDLPVGDSKYIARQEAPVTVRPPDQASDAGVKYSPDALAAVMKQIDEGTHVIEEEPTPPRGRHAA